MKGLIVAAASAVAILGLSACSDTDETTTQGVPPEEQQLQQQEPAVVPPVNEQPQAPAN